MRPLIVITALLWFTGLAQAEEAASPRASGDGTTLAETATVDRTQVTLGALLEPPSKARTGVSDLRTQMLIEAAKTVGFRGGVAARARVLIDALNDRSLQLDTIFQFSPLISPTGTTPPVIVQARDVAAFSPDQVRTATRVYKIEKEERFVSVPPTWRDYLFIGLQTKQGLELPSLEARPQDGKEESIWKNAVTAGWEEGQQQADAILAANFNRLTRDYTGMMLYSTLLQQSMISASRVAETQQTVTGENGQLILGDKLKRLTKRAEFEHDPLKWRPTITSGKTSESLNGSRADEHMPAQGSLPGEPALRTRGKP